MDYEEFKEQFISAVKESLYEQGSDMNVSVNEVQAAYLPVKGLQQLIKTISRVQKRLNPDLRIEGILLTMVDNRTNYAKDISKLVYDSYSDQVGVFKTIIPLSVRAAEISAEGSSIYQYDPRGKAANAYKSLTKEVADSGR